MPINVNPAIANNHEQLEPRTPQSKRKATDKTSNAKKTAGKIESLQMRTMSKRQAKGMIKIACLGRYSVRGVVLTYLQCEPHTREWPEKCDRCKAKGFACSENTRKRKPDTEFDDFLVQEALSDPSTPSSSFQNTPTKRPRHQSQVKAVSSSSCSRYLKIDTSRIYL